MPLAGVGTAASRRSTTMSGVMRSDSA
jgi:hypothetical protein